jgi:hypothetical protein
MIMIPADVFYSIICCVTHLYIPNIGQQPTLFKQ